jgi:hypothetical protein
MRWAVRDGAPCLQPEVGARPARVRSATGHSVRVRAYPATAYRVEPSVDDRRGCVLGRECLGRTRRVGLTTVLPLGDCARCETSHVDVGSFAATDRRVGSVAAAGRAVEGNGATTYTRLPCAARISELAVEMEKDAAANR